MTRPHRDTLITLGLALVAFAVYALVAPTGLMGADNGEFVTLANTPGVAHPPGYPLYVIYLRATSWFPGVNAAHSAALATAVLGAASIAMLFLALRRWSFEQAPAAAAAIFIGLDATVWGLHSHAEVFALNNLVAAGIFWAAAPGSRRGLPRALTLGLLAGLGLSNHHSIIFLAPVGLYGLYLAIREHGGVLVPIVGAVCAGFVGLLPYLYLLGGAAECTDCLTWGRIETFGQLVDHFLRADYGTTQLRIDGTRDPVTQWLAFGRRLIVGSWGVLPVAAAIGIYVGWKRHLRTFLVFGATFVGCGIVFIGLFNIDPEGIGAHLVSRFYALPIVVLAPFVAASLSRPKVRRITLLIMSFAALMLAVSNGAKVLTSHTGAIDAYVHDVFAGLPEDAVLFGTGDHRTFGAAYYQLVQGERRDVLYIDGELLGYDWYVEQLERRTGLDLPRTDDAGIPIGAMIATFLHHGRPVFATHPFTEVISNHPSYPVGPLLHLLGVGEFPPHPRELARINSELYDRFELDTPRSEVTSPWELEVYDHYARTWSSIGAALEQLGDKEGAHHARTLAAAYETEQSSD